VGERGEQQGGVSLRDRAGTHVTFMVTEASQIVVWWMWSPEKKTAQQIHLDGNE